MIDPGVRQALTGGTARVIVELRVAGMPPGVIASAQQHVIDALAGTPFRVSRRYARVPLLGLEIGAQSLAVLERLADLVARVVPDGRRPPASSTTPSCPPLTGTADAGTSA